MKLPSNGVVDDEGFGTVVVITKSSLQNGLQIPFIHPVCDVLDFLQLTPAQFHAIAWQILMSCCVLCHLVLTKAKEDYPDLTAREFLFTLFVDSVETFVSLVS